MRVFIEQVCGLSLLCEQLLSKAENRILSLKPISL